MVYKEHYANYYTPKFIFPKTYDQQDKLFPRDNPTKIPTKFGSSKYKSLNFIYHLKASDLSSQIELPKKMIRF